VTKTTWIALLTVISTGGLATIVQALGTLIPKAAGTIATTALLLTALASFALLVINRANAPAVSILADAPVVSAKTGAVVGTNVSTTSTLPITALQKGPL
jgi:hypothetical protein